MAQLDGKWVKPDTLNGSKIRLDNDEPIRGRNVGDTADVAILKINASDAVEFVNQPKYSAAPVANDDLANKAYILDVLAGLRDPKDAVQLASTANVALTGEQTIDGVLTSASRVLLKDQTDQSENGIYVTAAGAWSRASDADTDAEVSSGMSCLVTEGTLNARKVYVLTTADPIVVDTSNLVFAQAPNPANFLVPKQVDFTLLAGDITNGYVDLAHEAENESVIVTPLGGPKQQFGIDYTVSTVSNVSRITFAGNLASLVAAGDVLLVTYSYATS